jgi:hypothetical protein
VTGKHYAIIFLKDLSLAVQLAISYLKSTSVKDRIKQATKLLLSGATPGATDV